MSCMKEVPCKGKECYQTLTSYYAQLRERYRCEILMRLPGLSTARNQLTTRDRTSKFEIF